MLFSAYAQAIARILQVFRQDAAKALEIAQAGPASFDSDEERQAAEKVRRDAYVTALFQAANNTSWLMVSAARLFVQSEARRQANVDAVLPPLQRYPRSLVEQALREAGGKIGSPETHARVMVTLDRHMRGIARSAVMHAAPDMPDDLKYATDSDTPLSREEEQLLRSHSLSPEKANKPNLQTAKDRRRLLESCQRDLEKIGIDASDVPLPEPEVYEPVVDDEDIAVQKITYEDEKPSSRQSGSGSRSKSGGKRQPREAREAVAWARVINPAQDHPCGFCIMCASRGPVYTSKQTALTANGIDTRRYHNNCTCLVVPVYTSKDWPGKEEQELWLAVYEDAKDNKPEGVNVITAMDNYSRGKRSEEKSEARDRRERAEWREQVEEAAQQEGWEILGEDLDDRDWTEWEKDEWDKLAAELADHPTFDGDLPDVSHVKATSGALKKHWDGLSGDRGGHSAASTNSPKTHAPGWWTFSDYSSAVRQTLNDPEFFSILPNGKKATFGREVDGVLMRVMIDLPSGKISHAHPIQGRGVVELRSDNTLSRIPFREGNVRQWQHVRKPR